MPTVDETIDLSIRERSIPFISLAKKEKKKKKKKTRKDILSPLCYPVLLLDFYYFNCDDAHSVLFCYFPLCALLFMLCASFWSFLVIEYVKKQSQPT